VALQPFFALERKTAFYFLGKRLLGQSLVHPQSKSHAFFCGRCGDIWARVIVEGAFWRVWENACSKHENKEIYTWDQPPGSIVPPGFTTVVEAAADDPLVLERLPRDALRYEFERSIEFALRSNE